MIHDLPFFSGRARSEPHHDPWPLTWRLPSGAIRVEASFKEPGRQKLVDRSTKAVAFLALVFIVIRHDQWPWSDLVRAILEIFVGAGPIPIAEYAAAWLFVAVCGIGAIVGIFRLLLATLGVDQGRISLMFDRDHLLINGRAFEQQSVKGFELEPHHLGKMEGQNEKRLGQATSLYYRDAYTIILQYAERRIETAQILGRRPAAVIVARLQELQKQSIELTSDPVSTLSQARA